MTIKKFLPYISAIIIFIVVTMVYFSPLMEGKKLYQGDITNHKGMSQEIVKYRETHNDQEPLWTNSMFGGMPAYQISTKYPNNLVAYFDKLFMLFLPHPAGYVFLYMIGFFILLLAMRIDPWLAIGGSLAFALSSYFFIILNAGHNSKAQAIGYMAPVIAGVILAYRGKYILGACLTALFLSLELHANHLQITYYLMLMLLLFGVAQFVNDIKEKQISRFFKASGLLVAAAALAVIPNVTNLWTTYEYGEYSTRGKSELTSNKENKTSGLDRDYATGWSYGIGETMTLMIPNFKGGASEAIGNYDKEALKGIDSNFKQHVSNVSAYWGDQPFTSGPVYVGAIICFLFVLGLFVVKGAYKWWLLAATLLSIMLAWGKHFMGFTNFFLDYMPGYNKFRAVSMTLVIAELTIPLLAILTLDYIIKNVETIKASLKSTAKEFNFKYSLIISMFLTAGICLFYIVVPSAMTFFGAEEYDQIYNQVVKSAGDDVATQFMNSIETARQALLKSDLIRSFLFILFSGILIYVFIAVKQNKSILIAALSLLIIADMWPVNKRYLNKDNFVNEKKVTKPFQTTEADLAILQDTEPDFRVFNTTARLDQDSRTSYFHKSLGGYHGAKLKRYQELIDFHLASKRNMNVINMLNTKYFIIQDQQSGQTRAIPNPERLGAAWFVDSVKMVANSDSEITALTNFNPKTTVVVDQRYSGEVQSFNHTHDSTRSIAIQTYEPNHLTYKSHSNTNQLAVFSEIYYDKGWNAYVDGKQQTYFRTNYVLRGMLVPAGEHTVEFKFEPEAYYKGEKISLAGSILLLLLVIGGFGFEAKRYLKP